MTTVSVSNTSNRGCPSSLAGTTCRRDRSRISATALRSTIRCRTDPSGRFSRHAAHSRHHHPSATIPAYSRLTRRTPTHQQLVTGACSNLPTDLVPGLPIGDKRAFPLLTVSAPNSSQKYNSLQNRRDRGDLAEHHLLDHFDDLDGLTGHRITTRSRDAPRSSGGRERAFTGRYARRHAPPPQAHFLSAFVIGPPIWAASCTPASSPFLSSETELGPFIKVFTDYSDREPIFPCFSFAGTHLMHHQQNSNSCTPPALRRRPRFLKTLEGVPMRTPASEGLAAAVRASTIFTTLRGPMRPTSSLSSSCSTCRTQMNSQETVGHIFRRSDVLCASLTITPASWMTPAAASFACSPIPTAAFPSPRKSPTFSYGHSNSDPRSGTWKSETLSWGHPTHARNVPATRSVHRSGPVEAHLPPHQLRNDPTWIFPTDVISLYSPAASRMGLPTREPTWAHM